ncbi:MAG: N-acetyltransferase family protein [Bacteroidaceae bacterium]|nr:N-acetyltransferase family protein [Bacteroidaceae bacterium]
MIHIRQAHKEDAAALSDIYAYYVLETAVSFEMEAPNETEFRERIAETMISYPYLVAEDETGRIVGYAYAHRFHPRAALAHCVESSVYLHHNHRGQGTGTLLMDALEAECRERGYLNMYASIATAEEEDPYVTDASLRFHEARGYRLIGEFRRCGHKFGRWYNLVWMGRFL